jgi:hypothetical protein
MGAHAMMQCFADNLAFQPVILKAVLNPSIFNWGFLAREKTVLQPAVLSKISDGCIDVLKLFAAFPNPGEMPRQLNLVDIPLGHIVPAQTCLNEIGSTCTFLVAQGLQESYPLFVQIQLCSFHRRFHSVIRTMPHRTNFAYLELIELKQVVALHNPQSALRN